MMFVLCFYTGLMLAIIYMFFVSFPYTFDTLYHFKTIPTGLSFMGIVIGMIVAGPSMLHFQKVYQKRVDENGGISIPEFRFHSLFYGAFAAPAGLMIIAWTAYKQLHWIGPIIGSAVFAAGVLWVFSGILSYTADAYRLYTASALACNCFVRSMMSAAFPLFARQMYQKLGVNWAGFIVAMASVAMIPIPFLFTKYGAVLRSKSKYTWSDN